MIEKRKRINRLGEADDTFSKLALACVYAHAGDHTVEVLQTYHEIVDQHTSCDPRLFALQLLLMLGRSGEAEGRSRQAAREFTGTDLAVQGTYRVPRRWEC